MSNDKELCTQVHKRVDETLDRHTTELKEHTTMINTLEKSDATNTSMIKELCGQLSSLTKSIYSLAIGVGIAILTVLLTALFK